MDSKDISGLLNEVENLKREPVGPKPLDPRLALLQRWQSDRLARTYADLAAIPRYQALMQFFLEDIYAARDFSQRNHDMEQMYAVVRHIAPGPVVRPLTLTVELHQMTERLDRQLLDVLTNRLGMTDSITIPLYAQAYRDCDNYDERVQQIELIHDLGMMIDVAVHMPFGGAMLTVTKGALRRGGWADLIAFMERGHRVFSKLGDTEKILGIIRQRELRILNRIYAGESDPFQFPAA